jgi:hypothetical protein
MDMHWAFMAGARRLVLAPFRRHGYGIRIESRRSFLRPFGQKLAVNRFHATVATDTTIIDSEALAGWTEEDFSFFLFLGMKPDDDFVGGEMERVVEHSTSKLTKADREALAAFFKRQ